MSNCAIKRTSKRRVYRKICPKYIKPIRDKMCRYNQKTLNLWALLFLSFCLLCSLRKISRASITTPVILMSLSDAKFHTLLARISGILIWRSSVFSLWFSFVIVCAIQYRKKRQSRLALPFSYWDSLISVQILHTGRLNHSLTLMENSPNPHDMC